MPQFWIQTAINLLTIIVSVLVASKLGDKAAAKYSEELRLRRELEFERAILLQLKQASDHALEIGRPITTSTSKNPLDSPVSTLPTAPFSAVFQPQYHPLAKHGELLQSITAYLLHAEQLNFYIALRQTVLERTQIDSGITASKSLRDLTNRIYAQSFPVTDSPGPPSDWWRALAALQKEIRRALNDLDSRM